MSDGVERVSLTTDPELIDELDAVVDEWNYASRSKAFRDALRMFLADRHWDDDTDRHHSGSITIVYEHDVPGLNDELLEIQHDNEDVIVSTQHVHFDAHRCLETIVVDGPGDAIQDLVHRMESLGGVKQVRFIAV